MGHGFATWCCHWDLSSIHLSWVGGPKDDGGVSGFMVFLKIVVLFLDLVHVVLGVSNRVRTFVACDFER